MVDEQYIRVVGRDIFVSKNLKTALQEGDNLSEIVPITMSRYYDGVDFDTKQVELHIKKGNGEKVAVNLNSVKTVSADELVFDFVFENDITDERGYIDLVIVVKDTDGYKWSSKQASKILFIGGNFTSSRTEVPYNYYVDLEGYKDEIVGYLDEVTDLTNTTRQYALTTTGNATNAAASATAAASSATNAAASALSALNNSSLAETHKNSAATSATAAATSKTAAATSATNAATSATNAAASATASASSASTASAKATEAAASATSAANKLAEVTAEGTKQIGLVTAEGTKQKNEVTTIGDQKIALATAQADRAKQEADNAVSAVADKVKLDGVSVTDVNFIQRDIVRDGFIKSYEETVYNGNNITFFNQSVAYDNGFTFQIEYDGFDLTTGLNVYVIGGWAVAQTDALAFRRFKTYASYRYRTVSGGYAEVSISGLSDVSVKTKDVIILKGNKLIVYNNGNVKNIIIDDLDLSCSNVSNFIVGGFSGSNKSTGKMSNTLFYNRPLTQQEINHNFSVLNNSQSVDTLEFTDSSSNKNQLLLGTTDDLVLEDTGYTARESKAELLNVLAETFNSTDGSAIEVENAIPKQHVLGASMQGRTVKNVLGKDNLRTYYYKINTDETVSILRRDMTIGTDDITLKAGSYYIKTTKECRTIVRTLGGATVIDAIGTGTRFTLSVDSDLSINFLLADEVEQTYPFNIGYVSITDVDIQVAIPFGLSSSKAIISVNGQDFPLYASEEDKASKKVLSCGEGSTVNVNDDMSVGVVDTWNDIVLNGENFTKHAESTNDSAQSWYMYKVSPGTLNSKAYGRIMCGILNGVTWMQYLDISTPAITINDTGWIFIKTPKSITTQSELDAYLNRDTARYELRNQTAQTIPSHINKAIPVSSNKISISVSDAVAPESFDVKVAVDKVTDLNTRLTAIEEIINTPSNISLMANYVEDEYNKELDKLN